MKWIITGLLSLLLLLSLFATGAKAVKGIFEWWMLFFNLFFLALIVAAFDFYKQSRRRFIWAALVVTGLGVFSLFQAYETLITTSPDELLDCDGRRCALLVTILRHLYSAFGSWAPAALLTLMGLFLFYVAGAAVLKSSRPGYHGQDETR